MPRPESIPFRGDTNIVALGPNMETKDLALVEVNAFDLQDVNFCAKYTAFRSLREIDLNARSLQGASNQDDDRGVEGEVVRGIKDQPADDQVDQALAS